MKPEDFLKNARDPQEWNAKARSLRLSADAVWEEFIKRLLLSANKETRTLNEQNYATAVDVLSNCQLLYSLSAECALKGLIIKNAPKNVVFKTTQDGEGNLVDAQITRIGNTCVDTHNLEKLAELAGLLPSGEKPDTRELLAFCTYCIQWIGRYPVPLDSNSDFTTRGKLPGVVFGHYFRDFMDPFLDDVLSKLEDTPCIP